VRVGVNPLNLSAAIVCIIKLMARKVKAKASRSKKQRLLSDHRKAVAERRKLANYLKAANGILPDADRALLLEFAQIAKRKCDRLRRAIRQDSTKHAA
jgi:hypothetical protein